MSQRVLSEPRDEFFVGWLAVPVGHARFLRPLIAGLLLLAATAGVVVASRQQSPGAGVWEGEERAFEGLVTVSPYALLHVPGEPPRTLLVVEEGKFGAAERRKAFDGQFVRVTGTVLHRDGRSMLELASGDGAVRPITPSAEQRRQFPPGRRVLGRVTLRGEIIDPKCYLGAMKPGGGKTHKACAALCLSGGIPPMLVTRDGAGSETFYLLTTADGGPAGELVLPFVGDPVEVAGVLEEHGDLRTLRVDAGHIRRR